MDCVSCKKEKKRMYKGYCIPCFIREKSHKIHAPKLPSWFVHFSNKILPPLFFFIIAVVSLYYLNSVSNPNLKINLGIVSVVASSLSVYLTILTL